jgi:hypothetical protein
VFIDYELLRERNAALKEGGIFHNKQIELVFKNFGRTPAIVNGIKGKCLHWPNRHLPEMETDNIKIPSGIAILEAVVRGVFLPFLRELSAILTTR